MKNTEVNSLYSKLVLLFNSEPDPEVREAFGKEILMQALHTRTLNKIDKVTDALMCITAMLIFWGIVWLGLK